jgi:pimeloyl-ACP methyl ester carboxylesterase
MEARHPPCAPVTVCVIAFFLAAGPAMAQPAFYQAREGEIAGLPGTIIRQESIPFAPAHASAYRVLYRSTGLHDEPIAVSGIVIVPSGPAPAGGRPIVAWAHPTSGVVPRCAPSLALFFYQQVQGLKSLMQRGYVITATDYPGLGTPGPHPYLVGESEGHAVLDAVRAARSLPGTGGGDRFAVWGHSQGGQAALYAGLLAERYAPELHLAGVAAAAPATELATLMGDDFKSRGGKNLTAMTLWSWSRVFGAPIDRVVVPEAIPTVDRLAERCIESIFDVVIRQRMEGPLERSFLSVKNIAETEPWRSIALRNTPGTLPPDIPIFLAQGTSDQMVQPGVTQDYAKRLCRAGSKVRMVLLKGVGHGFAARDSANAAVDWMAGRFAGQAAPNDCDHV